MKRTIVVVLSALLFSGCAGGLTDTQKGQLALVINKCPVLQNYSRTQLKKAASEMKNLPSQTQIAKMIGDYGKLRDACRVVSKKLKRL
jgi:PBP1b-binding outer membrane lipoprotein LpoB